MAKRKSSPASTYTSGEQLTLEMDIEPLEELVVTVESFDEQIGNMLLHTDMTRRRGLHWITDRRGERVLVDESAVMDSGPKMGTTLCYTPHPRRSGPPTGPRSSALPPRSWWTWASGNNMAGLAGLPEYTKEDFKCSAPATSAACGATELSARRYSPPASCSPCSRTAGWR